MHLIKSAFCFLVIPTLAVSLFLNACSGSSQETAADHDLELPNGVESFIPLPADASIMTNLDLGEDGHSIVFRPGLSWPEAIEFFSGNLEPAGWSVTHEEIPEDEEGERTASWEAEGHGVSLRIEITAFGGRQGMNMSGIMLIE